MKIYKAKLIQDIEDIYGSLLFQIKDYANITEHLRAIAERMWEAYQNRHPAILQQISNYHPSYLGKTQAALSKISLQKEDCYHSIAREYGYEDWATLERMNLSYDLNFESAVNYLLAGALTELQQLIEAEPSLVHQTSPYGHAATLLHYTASNGVELWRQKLPYNLPEIVTYLLQQGADAQATMKVYGGNFTTLELLLSSAHPAEAGLTPELKQLLS